MDILLQQLINGITLGSIYALVALGYTMVYGIVGLINFAHGELVMVGALTALSVIQALMTSGLGLPPAVIVLAGLLVAVPVCMLLAYAMERIAYRPLRGAPRLAPLITAIGVSIVLQNLAMLVWGRSYFSFPGVVNVTTYSVGGAAVTDQQIVIVLLAAALMAGLLVVVHRTRLGLAMRATAENSTVAGLMGVDANRVIVAAFLLGAALAAIAGLMVSAYYGIAHYYMGFMLGLKAFTAAVLGGIGNLAGAMLGGLLLGVIESLGAGYIGDLTGDVLGSNYQDVFAFFVLILVLTIRPSGLLGERISERA
ncbi:MAG TPA: branched-chain amino acid ABC transporter permease [Burkholderiales bacterium]|nr:branched-chain amino acid ABC transporter permease [Burkholderiales bacterium]